ncbi:hypothetical protein B0H19DRAFT_1262003 [Mycena capillaripes]|nr:hypothetical protein B0H19DRAFT_1262003 [Mycena capillaripes]
MARQATLGMHILDVRLLQWLRYIDLNLKSSDPGLAVTGEGHKPPMNGVCGHGFYLDVCNMRAVDFEPLEICTQWEDSDKWNQAVNMEVTEEEMESEYEEGVWAMEGNSAGAEDREAAQFGV